MAIGALEELLYVLGGLVALWFAWRALEWGWLSPQRLGRALRAQGLHGTAYRFPAGDLKEEARLRAAERTKPMPLLSHGISARVEPLVHNTVKEHGKISMVWDGPTPRVIISDPKLVREVLSNKFGHFRKSELPSNFIKLIGKGLASHEGEKWVFHRKIINQAFHLEKLKKMLPAITACTSELIGRWEDSMGSGKAQEIDVWPELRDLTGDAISRAAFGSSLSEGRRIFRIQSEQIQLANHMTNLYIPGYTFLPTKLNRRIKANAREVEALLKGIITKRERAMKNGHADDSDMLGLLMQSNIKESQESGSSKQMMTMDDIIGELKLFYFAGMETTSVLLTWTMVVLSMHPEWQDRAREEVLRVFGKKQPDLDGANQLKIVTTVLYEVLRLYPPITLIERQTYKEMELGGIEYPPGVKLLLPIVTIHHDPDLWGEDADEFRPERFAEGISKASKDAPAFIPFGWGPRICIGQNFALLEAKIALSMILQRFSFGLSPSYTHAPFPVSTLQPDHGAEIMLKKL
ncbi:cytochrome P450 CYP72A616-like [Phragmites australis]|uniref:cytochrome P450 CYP72A616-like n=1 Tax=Phragmites australis TaxID=29695 RepID=UPI002D77DE10|nr:cytochrome P450 CYP72A616-like [Phragmites australis]